jgi:hypothetical protein
MVKSIAHAPASSHRPGLAKMWGRSTAYDWLAGYRQRLAPLMAASRSRGRPKRRFHYFVLRLREIARTTGGKLTHTKVPDKVEWYGTLMEALKILRPFLPLKGFWPNRDLGRSLEHVLGTLRSKVST